MATPIIAHPLADRLARDYRVGEHVALLRRSVVGATGTHEDWFVGAPERAHDGPLGPAWGEPDGHSVAWTGWGLGVVTGHTGDALEVHEVASTT